MARRGHFRAHEINAILKSWKQLRNEGKKADDVAVILGEAYGASPKSIKDLIYRLFPTTTVARQVFQANAMRLAERVVRRANVQESLDVLSRPEIGVLSPKQGDNGAGATRGFFLSVSADSCGAVKASVGVMEGQRQIAPPVEDGEGELESEPLSLEDPDPLPVIEAETVEEVPRSNFGAGNKKIQELRAKIQVAREKRLQRFGS